MLCIYSLTYMSTQIINNENKPEYGSKEYNRIAQRKHYETKGGREKAREYGKVKYYRSKYGREIVNEYQQKYGDNFITMLKIDKLKLSLSDNSSDSSNHGNDITGYFCLPTL